MIDEYTMLWIKRLVIMPTMMDIDRCGRNEDDMTNHMMINHHDNSDDIKMIKKDIDEREIICQRFTLKTCLQHCSFMSYLHPAYIKGFIAGKHYYR